MGFVFTNIQDLQKAYQEGVYADTSANRKLGRVGMTYKQAKEAEKAKEFKDNNGGNGDGGNDGGNRILGKVNKLYSSSKSSSKSSFKGKIKSFGNLPFIKEMTRNGEFKKLKVDGGEVIKYPERMNPTGLYFFIKDGKRSTIKNRGELISREEILKKYNAQDKNKEETNERGSQFITVQGIEFEKCGSHPYHGRNGSTKGSFKINEYKATGPTGNVVYTNDFNQDLSTSLPKDYSIYSITNNELRPAEYIRLKEDKAKDFLDGKASIEDAGLSFTWEYFVKNDSEEGKKLKEFTTKKMEHKGFLDSEESRKFGEFTRSRNLDGLIKLLDIKEKKSHY